MKKTTRILEPRLHLKVPIFTLMYKSSIFQPHFRQVSFQGREEQILNSPLLFLQCPLWSLSLGLSGQHENVRILRNFREPGRARGIFTIQAGNLMNGP